MKIFIKKIIFILFIFIVLFSIFKFTYCFFDSTPKIVTKLNEAFEKVESWFMKLATPAAAVAVGTGVFMKKFSFGDEERIRIAKKLIRSSLFSYGFILAIDLILSAIKTLIV